MPCHIKIKKTFRRATTAHQSARGLIEVGQNIMDPILDIKSDLEIPIRQVLEREAGSLCSRACNFEATLRTREKWRNLAEVLVLLGTSSWRQQPRTTLGHQGWSTERGGWAFVYCGLVIIWLPKSFERGGYVFSPILVTIIGMVEYCCALKLV